MAQFPLLLGHRGARSYPGVLENTCASFDLALANGCCGFEFDVRRTACGSAVICHDPQAGRVTISRARATQLPHLPTLGQILQKYQGEAFLDIELKVRNLESIVLTALHDFPPKRGYVISSFLPDVVMELKARSASAQIGIICENAGQLARWPKLPVDYVIAQHSLVDRDLVRNVHNADLKLFVWTVNDHEFMMRFAGWGVDGIISDECELLVRTLGSKRG